MTGGPISTLAWRHPLQPREGAAGFASRLASLNGRTMPQLLREMKIKPHDVDKGREKAVRNLARVGAADEEQLLRYTPREAADGGFQVLGGEKLYRLSILRTYFRFCPECVAHDLEHVEGPVSARPWLRMEWTVSHFRSCCEHGVTLLPASPERRRFEAPDFAKAMAAVVQDLDALRSAAATVPQSDFQAWLRRRLDGVRDEGNWLDDMPLYVGVAFCEGFGVSALHPPKVRTGKFVPTDWAEAADAGFEIASGGASSIEALLGRLNAAQTRTRGVWAPRDTFGYGYGAIEKTIRDPAWSKPRDLVADYVMRSLPLDPGTVVLGHQLAEQAVHTIRTAARASGAHPLTIRRLFERKGISADQVRAGLRDHRVTAVSDELASMVARLKGALTTPKVQKLTGIPLPWLRAIIAEGHLPTVTGSEEKEYAKHRFERSAVDAMLGRLLDGAVEVAEPTDDQVGLVEARSRAVASTERVLGIAFGGELRWKGSLAGRSGFDSLLVDVTEVLALVRSEAPKSGLTKVEVMRVIPGMGRDSVTELIKTGELEQVEEFSPEARRVIEVVSRQSVERFLAKYVALGELSQRHDLHHKQVRLLLRGRGIDGLFEQGRYRTFFYDRAAVDALERDDPGFWRYDKDRAQYAARRNRVA